MKAGALYGWYLAMYITEMQVRRLLHFYWRHNPQAPSHRDVKSYSPKTLPSCSVGDALNLSTSSGSMCLSKTHTKFSSGRVRQSVTMCRLEAADSQEKDTLHSAGPFLVPIVRLGIDLRIHTSED